MNPNQTVEFAMSYNANAVQSFSASLKTSVNAVETQYWEECGVDFGL